MDTRMKALVERAGAEAWPPLLADGEQIRLRGTRRRRLRRTGYVGAVGVAAAVAVVGTMGLTGLGRHDGSPFAGGIVVDQASDQVTSIFGVSVVLPGGWSAEESEAPDGQRRACLAPPDGPTGDCAITFAVASDPDNAFFTGVEPVPDVVSACLPGDPRIVTVTTLVIEGRHGLHLAGKCTEDSVEVQAWALANRTLEVRSESPRWDPAARAVFEQAHTPPEWPHHDSESQEATAGPR